MRVLVPPPNGRLWPTLGPEICDFIEDGLVHGPGDVLGDPIVLTDEQREIIYRLYEIYPHDHRQAGRRRFKRAVLSRRKGWSKTELAAWLAITEAHPDAPVRCDGWQKLDGEWIPVGRSVTDPYVPMVATTEEQTEDLAYGAVYAILTEEGCQVSADFDVGLDRALVRRFGSSGEIKPLAAAPSAREGARTSFQHFDETHLFLSERLTNTHRVMGRNLAKRLAADPWGLETTTAYAPGEGSVAESAHDTAIKILEGETPADPAFYFDHLQASEEHGLGSEKSLWAGTVEASGDAIGWADVPAIVGEFKNPKIAEGESRRYWWNQPRASANRWIAPLVWDAAYRKRRRLRKGSEVTLGFYGDVNRDSAGLVGCTPKGYLFVIGHWEPPPGVRITDDEVEAELAEAYERWEVLELATSRIASGWINEVEEWSDLYGNVVDIPINSPARMGPACDRLYNGVHDGVASHDDNPALARHIAACMPAKSSYGTYIRPAPGENQHISLARAAVLAYERANAPDSEPALEPMFAVTS